MLEARDKLITSTPGKLIVSRAAIIIAAWCAGVLLSDRRFSPTAVARYRYRRNGVLLSRDDLTNYSTRTSASHAIDQDIIVSLLRVRRSKRGTWYMKRTGRLSGFTAWRKSESAAYGTRVINNARPRFARESDARGRNALDREPSGRIGSAAIAFNPP